MIDKKSIVKITTIDNFTYNIDYKTVEEAFQFLIKKISEVSYKQAYIEDAYTGMPIISMKSII